MKVGIAIGGHIREVMQLAGRPDEALDRLRAWDGIADRVVLGVPWYGPDAARQREAIEAALELGGQAADGGRPR